MNLIGDVKGKVAVMVDDMIDTAGELSQSWILEYNHKSPLIGNHLLNLLFVMVQL